MENVVAHSEPIPTLFTEQEMGGVTLEDVIEAYFDCRRHKRYTANALQFEMNWEHNCIELMNELNAHRYKPRRSIVFVVEKPVKREIFAADFRDRVVHHLISRRIYPLLEQQFILDSYSTQKGKGTLMGIKRIEEHIRQCSENYTKDCWILKMDIEGFFMAIDKNVLYDKIKTFLEARYHENDLQMLLYMLRETIFNQPEKNCYRKMPKSRWEGLPKRKSLFGTDGMHGLPIGNLTSQLLALLYLDGLDHKVTEEWGIEHYGRYVDDMILIHPSKERLMEVRGLIDEYLCGLGLNLHPKKLYLQHYSKGVAFVGAVIKPGRKYVSNRTVARLNRKIRMYGCELAKGVVNEKRMLTITCSMNSYLGNFKHYSALRLFHRVRIWMDNTWFNHFYLYRQRRGIKLVRNRIDN